MRIKLLESEGGNVSFYVVDAIPPEHVNCHVNATPGEETVRVELSPGAARKLLDAITKALEEK